MVEPIGGLIGAAFVHYCKPMLPFTMSLAAGAMIFVVADSLVPEMQVRPAALPLHPRVSPPPPAARQCSPLAVHLPRSQCSVCRLGASHSAVRLRQAHGNKALAMQGLMLGFVVMMVLDVTLG